MRRSIDRFLKMDWRRGIVLFWEPLERSDDEGFVTAWKGECERRPRIRRSGRPHRFSRPQPEHVSTHPDEVTFLRRLGRFEPLA